VLRHTRLGALACRCLDRPGAILYIRGTSFMQQVTMAPEFIEQHGLWSDDQRRHAEELKYRIEKDDIQLIRVVWADPHGASRAKALTVPAFAAALKSGFNINVATATLDSANARTFASFTRGGGMGLDEMTGSPNLTIVPDPATFRQLPWAPKVGWVLCDEYFSSGVPFHFSPRQILRRQIRRLAERGMGSVVGLEIEWYLTRIVEPHLSEEHTGNPGLRGRPLKTAPAEPGFSYHSETNLDLMQPVISALTDAFEKIRLPLRSIENEWGPGQLECTFAARPALEAADHAILFRTATRQICRRMGHFASFMCRPAIKSFYASGWHLHQSVVDAKSGRNLFMPEQAADCLSPLGRNYLGGLMNHAPACAAFATPTVNGYRRYRPNSLAPDRATWCYDHRGVMVRVLGAPGDPATRLENRVGEPAANPYLYIASQIAAGLDGVEHGRDPGPPDDDPYTADRPLLPTTLPAALDALEGDTMFAAAFGEVFVDYFLKLKRNEAGRYEKWLADHHRPHGDEPTEWEQNEYFDFF
jgi:glutamine synthetase